MVTDKNERRVLGKGDKRKIERRTATSSVFPKQEPHTEV